MIESGPNSDNPHGAGGATGAAPPPFGDEQIRADTQLWVEMLEAAGTDDAANKRWHMEFERRAPEGHREFLLSLGIPACEVARIRSWSRGEIATYDLPEGEQWSRAGTSWPPSIGTRQE